MAGEIQLAHGTSGATLYAVVRSAVGTVWNTVQRSLPALLETVQGLLDERA